MTRSIVVRCDHVDAAGRGCLAQLETPDTIAAASSIRRAGWAWGDQGDVCPIHTKETS